MTNKQTITKLNELAGRVGSAVHEWSKPPDVGQEVWVVVRRVSSGTVRHYPESRHVVSADTRIACLLLRASLCDRLEFWPLCDVYPSQAVASDRWDDD